MGAGWREREREQEDAYLTHMMAAVTTEEGLWQEGADIRSEGATGGWAA